MSRPSARLRPAPRVRLPLDPCRFFKRPASGSGHRSRRRLQRRGLSRRSPTAGGLAGCLLTCVLGRDGPQVTRLEEKVSDAQFRGPALRRGILLGMVLLGIAVPALAGAQISFGPIVNVSQTPQDSRQPQIAVDDAGIVHVVWIDNFVVFHRRSFDRGQTFTPATRVSTGAGAALRPRLGLHGGAVYVTWFEDVSSTKDVFFARSLNGGDSFEAPRNISNTAGQSQEA